MESRSFRDEISRIYAAHGKTPPTSTLLEVIWERVSNLPDEFMVWAGARLRGQDKLPTNLGLHLQKELWPEWRKLNPHKADDVPQGCADCGGRNDVLGHGFYGFRRNSGGGWETVFFPCGCCPLPRDGRPRLSTKAAAARKGWIFMPESWESGLTQWEYRLSHGENYRPARRLPGILPGAGDSARASAASVPVGTDVAFAPVGTSGASAQARRQGASGASVSEPASRRS